MSARPPIPPDIRSSVILDLLDTASTSGELETLFGNASQGVALWLKRMADQASAAESPERSAAHDQEMRAQLSPQEITFLLDDFDALCHDI